MFTYRITFFEGDGSCNQKLISCDDVMAAIDYVLSDYTNRIVSVEMV